MVILKEVEPDIIFRHFVFSVFFVAGVAYYINNFIMPAADSYKEQRRFTRITQTTLDETKKVQADANARILAFSNANYKQLELFSNTAINEAMLRKNMPRGFLQLSIRKLKEEYIPEDKLKKTRYAISGLVTPSNLNTILQIVPTLQERNISATFELPFSIKKNSKGNLDFSMQIAVTQSTYRAYKKS